MYFRTYPKDLNSETGQKIKSPLRQKYYGSQKGGELRRHLDLGLKSVLKAF